MSKIIKVNIENTFFNINCEFGTQDVAWLAISACHLFGRTTYPSAKYIPVSASNTKTNEILHPKYVISKYWKKIGDEISVKIQKSDVEPSSGDKDWYEKAFGKEKYLMDVEFKFYPFNQDFKYNIKYFYIKFQFNIYSPLSIFEEYKTDEIQDIQLPVSQDNTSLHYKKIKLPYGNINVMKVYYKESEDTIKDVLDLNTKNKFEIIMNPEPLLTKEREQIIRGKELLVLDKENELKAMIKEIENENLLEEQRITALKDFLESIPFTLDDVYHYVTSQIINSETELDPIFELFHKNEFEYFKLMYQIFDDYSLYFDENFEYGEFISLDAIKHLFITHFDKSNGSEYETINSTFKYYYLDKKKIKQYRFDEFMFCLIYCLYYNNSMNSIEQIPGHINYLFDYFKQRTKEEKYNLLYKDKEIIAIIKENFFFLIKLFNNEAKEMPLPEYKEMRPNELKNIFSEIGNYIKNTNFIELIKEIKYDKGINFFSFLEVLIVISLHIEVKKDKGNSQIPQNKVEEDDEDNSSQLERDKMNSPQFKLQTLITMLISLYQGAYNEAMEMKENLLKKTKYSKTNTMMSIKTGKKSIAESVVSNEGNSQKDFKNTTNNFKVITDQSNKIEQNSRGQSRDLTSENISRQQSKSGFRMTDMS